MKLRISGHIIKAKIELFSSLLKSKAKDSYSGFVRLSVVDDALTLQYTNGSVGFTAKIYDILASESCSFLLNAELFWKFIKNHTEGLEIEVKETHEVDIRYANGIFTTPWYDDVYPLFFEAPKENIVLKSSYFVPVLKRAFAFITKNEFTETINRVFVNVLHDRIDVVSTDTFKLFKSTKEFDSKGHAFSFKISTDACGVLYAAAKNKDIDVVISSDDRRVYLSFEDVDLYELKTEDKFPNYQRVYDAFSMSYSMRIEKTVLLKSLERICSLSNSQNLDIRMADRMIIKLEDIMTSNKVIEDIHCIGYDGEPAILRVDKDNFLPSVKCVLGNQILIMYSKERRCLMMFGAEFSDDKIICSVISN